MTQAKQAGRSVRRRMPVCGVLLTLAVWPCAILCGQRMSSRARIAFPVTGLQPDGSPVKGLTGNELVLTVNGTSTTIRLEQPWLNGPERLAMQSRERNSGQVNLLFVISYPQMVFDSFAAGGPARRGAARRFQHDSLETIRKFVAAHVALGWNMAILNADGHLTAYTTDTATFDELAEKMEAEATPRKLSYREASWNTALNSALHGMRLLPGRNWSVSIGDTLSWRWARGTYGTLSRMISPVYTLLYARYPEWSTVQAARDGGVTLVACNATVHRGEKHYPPAGSYPFRARLHMAGENYGSLPFYVDSVPVPNVMEIGEIDPGHGSRPTKPSTLFGNPNNSQIVSYRHRLVAMYLQRLEQLPDLVNSVAAGQYEATALVPAGAGWMRLHLRTLNTGNSTMILAYPLLIRLHPSVPGAGKQHSD